MIAFKYHEYLYKNYLKLIISSWIAQYFKQSFIPDSTTTSRHMVLYHITKERSVWASCIRNNMAAWDLLLH